MKAYIGLATVNGVQFSSGVIFTGVLKPDHELSVRDRAERSIRRTCDQRGIPTPENLEIEIKHLKERF